MYETVIKDQPLIDTDIFLKVRWNGLSCHVNKQCENDRCAGKKRDKIKKDVAAKGVCLVEQEMAESGQDGNVYKLLSRELFISNFIRTLLIRKVFK